MAGEHVDVLIVGGGASGGVAGRRLAEAGLSVMCLEQGEWPDRARYPGATAEWELVAAKQWSSLPSVRDAPADYPLDLAESDLGVVNFNGVGGGTVLYAAQWPRMLPADFRVRSTDGVADDWPIGYDDLLPYYERIERDFGVSGLGGNPRYPPGADPPLPPLPIGEAGLRVARAHARLGWHWWPQSNAILSAPYDGRHACVQRGTCGSGCNEGAKASTDLTHWPHVVAHGGQVVTGARVRCLVTDRAGRVAGAEWIDRDGGEHRQHAGVVLLAANAIGSARLLLASADGAHPDGLANSSGLVGRRLMLHPLATVTGVFDDSLEGWQAHSGGLIQSLEFAASDAGRGFVRGALWELGSAGGPLRAVFSAGEAAWGAGHHGQVRRRLGRSAMWAVLCEDLPEESNRVELSSTMTDGSGLPAPKLVYRLSDNSARLMEWQVARATESLEEAGAHDVESVLCTPNGHFMGTARMGADAATSVVDQWCMAHDVANLGIVDGSVFVTAGAANPTSTIAAVALRAAERLIERRRDIVVASPPTSWTGFGRPGGPAPTVAPDAPVPTVAPPAAAPPAPAQTPVSLVRTTGHDPWSVQLRLRLAAVADVLIPGGDRMPAASEVGVQDALLDRVLRARPDLGEPLLRILVGAAGEEAGATVARLAVEDRAGLRALRWVVAGAYYLDAGVRDRLGYPGTVAHPVQALDYPAYIAEGLLDHLVS